jgi:Raf kinase inhibitor-like YbhB/YbcL family protein
VGQRAAGPPGTAGNSRGDPSLRDPGAGQPAGGSLELRSTAFSDHTLLPYRFSHEGGNVSPPVEWERVPDEAAELVLLCEDPDAADGGFTHWLLSGISPESAGLDEGSPPAGSVPGRNGFGEPGWGGPRPPVGDDPHQLVFRLYAVSRPTGLDRGADAADARAAVCDDVLAHGTLVGLFAR